MIALLKKKRINIRTLLAIDHARSKEPLRERRELVAVASSPDYLLLSRSSERYLK
jgi:hypothetical protein